MNQKQKSVETAVLKLWVAPAASSSDVNHRCVKPAWWSHDLTEVIAKKTVVITAQNG